MKLILVACLITYVTAGRLEQSYLPPISAPGAGGSGSHLNAPFGSGNSAYDGVAVTSASYRSSNQQAQSGILRYDNDNDGLGSYSYAYETQNHISAHEAGELKNAGSADEITSVHGSYSYTGPDGVTITVDYVADENGFQPRGAHLPVPPPIPDAILKSIQFNAASENAGSQFGQAGGEYQGKQYVPPNKPSFNSQTGYNY